jgi:hypothetical protein
VHFKHLKSQQQVNFTDPTSVYTQIERCGWQMGKMATETASNALCRHLELYEAKFMWQSQLNKDPFNAFLKTIKQ